MDVRCHMGRMQPNLLGSAELLRLTMRARQYCLALECVRGSLQQLLPCLL